MQHAIIQTDELHVAASTVRTVRDGSDRTRFELSPSTIQRKLPVCEHLQRHPKQKHRVQELCESRGGRPGLPVLMSLQVSVDVKQH